MHGHADGSTAEAPCVAREDIPSNVHLIGVGGSGMSGAAALLLEMGCRVSGSDLVGFEGMGILVHRGATLSVGHRAEQLPRDTELLVISAAVPEGNPELAAARELGIRTIKYAELLGLLMDRCEQGIAIAGTHGKTTTTAMCAFLLRRAKLDPSYLFGATSTQLGWFSGRGQGRHFVAESCEYDRSFLYLRPSFAAILNIEPDHLDFYRDVDDIVEAFGRFAANISPSGMLICNGDDPQAMRAAQSATATVETFGFSPGVDWQAIDLRHDKGRYRFVVQFKGEPILSTGLSIPGRYNVGNALAAVALAMHAGVSAEQISGALPAFAGVGRRLTWRGEGHGVVVVDDYAHHPTEVRVTIEAARHRYQPRRTWVVFQPHQANRTRHFMEAFAESLCEADEVVVPDIYGARETQTGAGPTGSQLLVERLHALGAKAHYLPELHDAAEHVANNVRSGDLVVTMGAGDVWKVADELVERICQSD